MRHTIYLDSHLIDYLWDFRSFIWGDEQDSLDRAGAQDRSDQIAVYELLRDFPILAWANGWVMIVGDEVFRELERIPREPRRSELIAYAAQVASIPEALLDTQIKPVGTRDRDAGNRLEDALSGVPVSDRALVSEAVRLGCSAYFTTDRGVLSQSEAIRSAVGLRIQRPTEFVDEEVARGRIASALELSPDISLFTWLIPGDV